MPSEHNKTVRVILKVDVRAPVGADPAAIQNDVVEDAEELARLRVVESGYEEYR